MFRKILNRRQYHIKGLFSDHFVEVKVFYVAHYNKVPCVTFIGDLDITPAFAFLRQKLEHETVNILQHSFFDHAEQKMFFNNSIIVLKDYRMIEVAGNYCQVLHTPDQYDWAVELVMELAQFRVQQQSVEAPATIIGFARQTTYN